MHLPPVPRFIVRWILRLVMLVLFVGVPGFVIYLREFGLGEEWRKQIAAALSKGAMHVSIEKLRVDPFRGLIAENVNVRDELNGGRAVGNVKQIVCSLNLAQLLARRVVIDSLEFDDTNVSIPLEEVEGNPPLEIRGVDAQIVFLGENMRLTRFEGDLGRIHISLTGLLKNPLSVKMPAPSAPAPHTAQRQKLIYNFMGELKKLKFPRQQPTIRAELSGDLADLKSLNVKPISLRCGPIVAPRWRLESLEVDAEYTGGDLQLSRLFAKGAKGSLSGWAQMQGSTWNFELTSSLDLDPFHRLFPKSSPVADLKFIDRPQIDVHGTFAPSPQGNQLSLTGSVQIGRFAFKDVSFENFAGDFTWQNGKLYARDVRVGMAKGSAVGDVMLEPGDFRLKLTNTIAPTALASLMDGNTRKFIDDLTFTDPPYAEINLRGPKPDMKVIKGTGRIKLGRTALRDIPVDWGQANLLFDDAAVTYRDLLVGRGKMRASGTLVYDFGRQQIRFDGIRSNLPPVDVLTWADRKIAEAVKPYRFHESPEIQAEGMIHMKDPKQNNLALKLNARDGLDYDLLGKTLNFSSVSGTVDVVGTKVLPNITRAAVFGGNVTMKADISTDPADPTYGASVTMSKINFAELTKLYFKYEGSKGTGYGKFKFTTRSKEESKMRGEGSLRVDEGNVFAIPILGPLSDILNKIIDGVGYQTAKLATVDFKVADQKISTDNLEIEGSGFSLFGAGDIFFVTDKMDMSVRINAHGIPGIVLFPVSKLFEYVSTGTVSKPEWRPKIIPRFGNSQDTKTPSN